MSINLPENSDQWGKLLAGQYVKGICEDNSITSREDIMEFIYSDCEAHEILGDILDMYVSEAYGDDNILDKYIKD